MLFHEFDQTSSLPFRFLANALNSYFGDDFEPGPAGFERRYVRCAVHKAKGRIAVADRSGFESHRVLMRKPASKFRRKLFAQVRTHIQVTHARTTAQPL